MYVIGNKARGSSDSIKRTSYRICEGLEAGAVAGCALGPLFSSIMGPKKHFRFLRSSGGAAFCYYSVVLLGVLCGYCRPTPTSARSPGALLLARAACHISEILYPEYTILFPPIIASVTKGGGYLF